MDDPSREAIEADFPKLRQSHYEIASPADPRYNCVAFTAGDYSRWWEMPYGSPRHYWPPGVNDQTVDDWVKTFRMLNYEITNSAEPEAGFDKIAIYGTTDDNATHVAVQRDGQGWMSKLGKGNDISHETLELLECSKAHEHEDCYGMVRAIMKRKSF